MIETKHHWLGVKKQELLFTMQRPPLSGNKMMKVLSKKVNIEHEFGQRSKGPRLIAPLYMIVSELDDGGPISRREFAKRYGLSSKGLSPNRD